MKVAITGGGGYVGSMLVPRLLDKGHEVTVLDTFWFGNQFLPVIIQNNDKLKVFKGDIRDKIARASAFDGQDAVIHLACVSNDPCFELNSELGEDINWRCFPDLIESVKAAKVKRFIYASSSSVYGVKDVPNVTEDILCEPLTDYSKFKLMCEDFLKIEGKDIPTWTIVRPATVCGWANRTRLDLVVNIMTLAALNGGRITVHGGSQLRPNLNIKDMVRAYDLLLTADHSLVHGETFNVGFENLSLMEIAEKVKARLRFLDIEIVVEESRDPRSYQVCSDKIQKKLGFEMKHSVEDAIGSISDAWCWGFLKDFKDNKYRNIDKMRELGLA